jgi:hypothetical protein
MAELGNFVKACFTELLPSKDNYKIRTDKSEIYWLDDSHAHYMPLNDISELEDILDNMTSKLGRTAMTDWGKNVDRVLSYKDFVETLKNCSHFNKNLAIDDKGSVSIIEYRGNKTEIYPSQEIRTGSHLHITAEGCLSQIAEGLDPRKTIELIHKAGGIALVEHPTTKCHPLWQYAHTNEEEDKLTSEVFDMADAAETFNSYNTLWMCGQNAKAKELVEGHGKIPAIAGSDAHFGMCDKLAKALFYKNMGKSGIYLPKYDNSNLTGYEIIQQKKSDLKSKNYTTLENYTGPITFFWEMIPPIVARKLGLDGDSIS